MLLRMYADTHSVLMSAVLSMKQRCLLLLVFFEDDDLFVIINLDFTMPFGSFELEIASWFGKLSFLFYCIVSNQTL